MIVVELTKTSDSGWPEELSSIGALRFARRSAHFDETVRFYRDLVGLPLCATFGESFGSAGAIFGLPRSTLTFEIVEATGDVPVDGHEQLCLYFPDAAAQQRGDGQAGRIGSQTR